MCVYLILDLPIYFSSHAFGTLISYIRKKLAEDFNPEPFLKFEMLGY